MSEPKLPSHDYVIRDGRVAVSMRAKLCLHGRAIKPRDSDAAMLNPGAVLCAACEHEIKLLSRPSSDRAPF
jgi:hypothetical protein